MTKPRFLLAVLFAFALASVCGPALVGCGHAPYASDAGDDIDAGTEDATEATRFGTSYPTPTGTGIPWISGGHYLSAAIAATDAGQVCISNDAGTCAWGAQSGGGGGSFTAGGDLSGTSSSQTVIGIQGNAVAASTPAQGDILAYWSGSAWTKLAHGSSAGQLLQTGGASANPSWSSNILLAGGSSDYISLGASAAGSGYVRLPNTGAIDAELAGGGGAFPLLAGTAANHAAVGGTSGSGVDIVVGSNTEATYTANSVVWGPVTTLNLSAATTTTNATVTTVFTFAMPSSTTEKFVATVVARTTGGGSGVVGDSWSGDLLATYKNVSGTVTAVGTNPSASNVQNDSSLASDTAAFSISGTNVLFRVTGIASITQDWEVVLQATAVN